MHPSTCPHVLTCTHTQVGDADNIPPAPIPVAVVTNSYEEEDSDVEVLDSTDWETSSGGEEEAEEVHVTTGLSFS